jgi:hypothetical protein
LTVTGPGVRIPLSPLIPIYIGIFCAHSSRFSPFI